MKITPIDIQQQQFRVRFRGFDIQEVDLFLESALESFNDLIDKNDKLQEINKRLQLENQGYRKREEAFKRAMINSQKVLEQMKANAQKEADLLLAEAEVKAEKILNGAHNRLAQLHEDIAELKRQRMQIEIQIRAIIESHAKMLDISNEAEKDRENNESKIKFLKKR